MAGTLIFPVLGGGGISSGFGPRSSPGGIGSTNHKGIDIKAPTGTPVVAPTDIQITSAGWGGGYGNLIRGQDSAGNTYEFGHLSAIGVSKGDTVSAGAQIGAVGSTGNSTGPHLHFGIKDAAGKFVDPSKLLADAKKLGSDVLKKGKDALGAAAKGLIIGGPAGAAVAVGAELLGGGGDECGDLDFVCKLKKWFKESNFFARFGMTVVAIILLIAAFSLLARSQTGRMISLKPN